VVALGATLIISGIGYGDNTVGGVWEDILGCRQNLFSHLPPPLSLHRSSSPASMVVYSLHELSHVGKPAGSGTCHWEVGMDSLCSGAILL